MKQISLITDKFEIKKQEIPYKNKRDEMIKKAVFHINLLRKGTAFENKIETPEKLAKRINMNPFLAGEKRDGELEMILNECSKKKNYSHLYYLLK